MEADDWLGLLLQVHSQEEEKNPFYLSAFVLFCPPSPPTRIRLGLAHDLQLESKFAFADTTSGMNANHN